MKVTINTNLKPMMFITDEEFIKTFQEIFEDYSSENRKEEIKDYLRKDCEEVKTCLLAMKNANIDEYLLRRVLYSNSRIIDYIKSMTKTSIGYFNGYNNFNEKLKGTLRGIAYKRIEESVFVDINSSLQGNISLNYLTNRFRDEMVVNIYSENVYKAVGQNIEHCIYEILRPITDEVLKEQLNK